MFEGELMPEKAAKNKNDVLRVNLRKEAGCVWKATESRGKDLLVTYSPQQQEHDNTSSTIRLSHLTINIFAKPLPSSMPHIDLTAMDITSTFQNLCHVSSLPTLQH